MPWAHAHSREFLGGLVGHLKTEMAYVIILRTLISPSHIDVKMAYRNYILLANPSIRKFPINFCLIGLSSINDYCQFLL